MTTYERIIELLGDGEWHPVDDLRLVTRYPDEWVRELRHEGHAVVGRSGDAAVVRLRCVDRRHHTPRPDRRPQRH